MKKLYHKIIVSSDDVFDRIYRNKNMELNGYRPFNENDIVDLQFLSKGNNSYGMLSVKETIYDKVNDKTLVKFKNNFEKRERKKSFWEKFIDF